jgi:DNA-dependent RNA polymerase auxiliary subunit epsilon
VAFKEALPELNRTKGQPRPLIGFGVGLRMIPKKEDPIREGTKVLYLGKQWTVTQRKYLGAECCPFEISRINSQDQLETVNPPYLSELITLIP